MKRLLLFVLAAVAFAACEQAPIEEQSVIRQEASETITVGFEGDDTRIQLNEAQKTVWNSGDEVSVFYRSNGNQKWQYKGEDGVRQATLSCVQDATGNTSITKTVVVYPYDETYWLNTDSYCIEATTPATQHYAVDSYGVGDNLMVSQGEFTQFSLKNVYGWLKLQLTGDGETIKSIKFRGNDGEQVAGLIYVDTATAEATLASEMGSADDNNAGGSLVFDDTILTEVVLDCGEGVMLGAEATTFFIALPPQTFTQGFTVDVECEDHKPMTISTENAVTIERNHIQPMAGVEHDASPIVPNNQIWYTSNYGDIVEPNNTNVFGANIVSNTYTNGKGVITFGGDVTSIGSEAFASCSSLTSVNIPDSVTTIGESAFLGCHSLTSVNIGDSVTTIGDDAFYSCDSLKEFTGKFADDNGRILVVDGVLTAFAPAGISEYNIPDSVTTIGEGAFGGCDSLISVNIPDSVTSIGEDAFYECDSLTSVNIGDSVTTIGDYAFAYCYSLTSVNIGDSVTTIGEGAFAGCKSLKEFKGKYATEDGRSLIVDNTIIAYANASGTIYTIPDSVTTIGNIAFYWCDSLISVNIPDSVTSIGEWAFAGCDSLTSVIIPDSVTTIGEHAFYHCDSLTSVTIGDSVTTIGDDAFSDCSSLTSVTIGDSVTTIGDLAFHWCDSLTSVNIPDSVTTIGNYAFRECDRLTSVTIGDSVTTIGGGAFAWCESLTSVYCKATTPPSLGDTYVFYKNGSGRKIYVPAESVEAYKSAQYWSEYASMIVSDPMVHTVLGSYDPNKYITYVEDYDYRGYGDAFDYNVYYYGTTIYSDGLLFSSKVECKFRLNSFSSGTFYISVGEYDDEIYDIYVNNSGLNIGDTLYTWGDMGVSKTDVITLTLSGTTMVVNGKTISGIPSVGRYLDGYIWSGHYHERDDGMWWMDYTFQDGARIYYAKGWNSAGDLIYLGGASLSADGRACWKSTYSEYGTGNIITKEHFPRVTSSFGRGNL